TKGFSHEQALAAIGQQFIWVIILILPIYVLWNLAKKQLIIQGG
ncbi:daunorubicin ABC transporter permease, partial [Neobacillus vireti]